MSINVELTRVVAATLTANGNATAGRHTPVDATSGAVTVTLPAVSAANVGAKLSVEKIDTSANTVTVSGSIRGSASILTLTAKGAAVELLADSAGSWWPIHSPLVQSIAAADSSVVVGGTSGAPTVKVGDLSATYVSVTEPPLNPFAPKYGAKGDGVTDDTAAIQAALDDAWRNTSTARPVELTPPPTSAGYLFSTLKLGQGAVLRGQDGMFTVRMKRIAGSTGAAIREKNASEGGNSAQGIQVRGLYLDCAGCSGNGIDLGNQGGADWGFNGVIEDVHVRNAAGYGFYLAADAVVGRNLSAYFNANGFGTASHGNNKWYNVTASQNTSADLNLAGMGDAFFGLHLEPLCTSSVVISATGNRFWGVSGWLTGNTTDLFKTSQPVDICGVQVANNGFTLTNMVTNTTTPAVSVAAVLAGGFYLLGQYESVAAVPSYFYDASQGRLISFGPSGAVKGRALYLGIRLSPTSTSFADSDGTILSSGSSSTITLPAAASYSGRICRIRNTNASNACTVNTAGGNIDGSATASLAANTHAVYQSDGSNWWTV